MCGIYGYAGSACDLASDEALATALQALRHRGPDDRGTFRDVDGAVACGLAHTRLAIIDLSPGGHQPWTTPDGRFTVVYNGELYNHAALRGELERDGRRFTSTSDTEVLLAAYVRWGADALRRFRGMFAFGIWDARERTLFVARDRLGIKPLYYAARGNGVAFASEVRALLAVGATPRRLSRAGIASYLAFGAVSCPDTIIEGIRSLPPGHTLELRHGEVTVRRYWELPVLEAGAPPRALRDEIEALRPILQEAVDLHLVADVPVGVFLSGGIDSSALVSVAAKRASVPLHTFTLTFDEAAFNEADEAAAIAKRYGCVHQHVHFAPERAEAELGDAIAALDQPSADGINTYFVSKAARAAGLVAVLSGLGGDEVFAGYGTFRAFEPALRLSRAARIVPRGARRRLQSSARVRSGGPRARKLAALLDAGGDPASVYRTLRAMFLPEERADLVPGSAALVDVAMPASLSAPSARGFDAVSAFSALELSNYTKNTLLRDGDAMSMAHSLEVRVPFLDHVLVERALAVRGALKLQAASKGNKPLLTSLVGDLPVEIVRRPKTGFTLPFDVWLRGSLRGWVEGALFDHGDLHHGLFETAAVQDLWRSFLAGRGRVTHARVWCLAALAAWAEANRVTS